MRVHEVQEEEDVLSLVVFKPFFGQGESIFARPRLEMKGPVKTLMKVYRGADKKEYVAKPSRERVSASVVSPPGKN